MSSTSPFRTPSLTHRNRIALAENAVGVRVAVFSGGVSYLLALILPMVQSFYSWSRRGIFIERKQ